mgnify:CR=1 FL=1
MSKALDINFIEIEKLEEIIFNEPKTELCFFDVWTENMINALQLYPEYKSIPTVVGIFAVDIFGRPSLNIIKEKERKGFISLRLYRSDSTLKKIKIKYQMAIDEYNKHHQEKKNKIIKHVIYTHEEPKHNLEFYILNTMKKNHIKRKQEIKNEEK